VVDPGPDDPQHRDAILRTCRALAPVAAILLTHHHHDHSDGAPALALATGAPVLGGQWGSLPEGELALLGPDGPKIHIVPIPGHTTDSVGIHFVDDFAIATGDTMFAEASSMIAWPDGTLSDYFSSLSRLEATVARMGITRVLPGHGPIITNPLNHIALYYEHRMHRLDQVRDLMDAEVDTITQIVYGDIDPELYCAAVRNVEAQLEYLRDTQDLP